MPKRIFANWLHEYMDYSSHSEAPDTFHFWTGVSCIAGALRRRVWIDQGYFQWTPNFYIVFVAPPGIVSKSTTANIGMRLLKRVPGVFFGPNSVTWQSLIEAFTESTQAIELPDGEIIPQSALTIMSSEFGTFLDPKDRAMVDVLVEMWDGQIGAWEKRTKTSGNDTVQNPWINLIACTTPAWISGNFPEYMIGGGFTSRTVFVYAEQKRQLIAYPKDHMPQGFEQRGDKLVRDLEHISTQMLGEMKLSPEAKQWGEKWYETVLTKRTGRMADDRFSSYFARKQTHVHKLAIVLSAAASDSLIIEKRFLEESALIVESLEADMPKVFANITSDASKSAQKILDLVIRTPGISKETLFNKLFYTMGNTDFTEGITSCIRSGMIREVQRENGIFMYPKGELNVKPSNATANQA